MKDKIIFDIFFSFIRHAHAVQGRQDETRPLSKDGIMQAKNCGVLLSKNIPFDLVITSSATRSKETADEILNQFDKIPQIIEVREIYLPLDDLLRERIEILIERLGSRPLRDYIAQDVERVWEKYSKSAFNAVLNEISKYKPKRVLIIGHGNIINSLGLLIDLSAKPLFDIYFNYCEGFEITSRGIERYITL